MPVSSYPQLEYFHFTGNATKENVKEFYEYINSHPLSAQWYIPPPEFLKVIDGVKKSIGEFGVSLGFDLSKRIKYLDRTVFIKQEDMSKAEPLLKPRAMFRSNENFKIYVSIDDSSGTNRDFGSVAHSLNHEFIHSISFQEVFFYKEEKHFELVTSGMKVGSGTYQGKFFLLNESLTELTNIYIINKFWPSLDQTRQLVELATNEISLPNAVSFLNALFEKLSEESNLNYDQVLEMAQKDMLTGSEQLLSLFREKVGETLISDLSETRPPNEYDPNYLIEMAEKYKLTKLNERVTKDLKNGRRDSLHALSMLGCA